MRDKYEIYSLNGKELKKEIKKFNKTYYGKIIFTLAYAVPLLCLLLLILSFTVQVCLKCTLLFGTFNFMLVMFTFVSFIIGSIYYYSEIRKFVNQK